MQVSWFKTEHEKAEEKKEEMKMAIAAQSRVAGHVIPASYTGMIAPAANYNTTPRLTLTELLAARMRWHHYPPDKFHFIDAKEASEHVYVFVITNSSFEAITLKDEASIFPSDELCGKLRLIEG
jgi:hypothetical protein